VLKKLRLMRYLQTEMVSSNLKRLSGLRYFLLCLYPTVFLGKSLIPGSTGLLSSSNSSDVLGTVRQSQTLDSMFWPWSKNLMENASSGLDFWNLTAMVQGVNWVALWLLNRVIPPIQAVTWWIWIGWVLSGISVYILAKKIGATELGAISGAVLFEMLPWVREKAATHIAYVFVCIPIFLILLLIRFDEKPDMRRLFCVLGFTFSILFFDLYWFYFSATLLVMYSVFRWKILLNLYKTRLSSEKLVIWFSSTFVFFGALTLFVYLKSRLVATNSGGLLNVWSEQFIDQFQTPLWFFIRPSSYHLLRPLPDPNVASKEDVVHYVGIIVLILAFTVVSKFALTRSLRTDWRLKFVLISTAIFSALTVPSKMHVLGIDISTPVSLYRFATPGIRVFARTGLISQALICVLAGLAISFIEGKFKLSTTRYIVALSVTVLAVLDLNPFGGQKFNSEFGNYKKIRNILETHSDSYLYVLQPETDLAFFSPHLTNANLVNDPRNRNWDTGIWNAASGGECVFSQWLTAKGAKYILVPNDGGQRGMYSRKWGVFPSVTLNFEDNPCFNFIESADDGSSGFLYKVSPPGEELTAYNVQALLINWQGVRETFFKPNYVKRIIFEDGRDVSWVINGETPTITVQNASATDERYVLTFSLAAAYGESAQPQIIGVRNGSTMEVVSLKAGPPTIFSIEIEGSDEIRLEHFLPCTIPSIHDSMNTDTRQLCFGITDVRVKQVVP
jgi:hypothetical protein